jgi:hypothetical protein
MRILPLLVLSLVPAGALAAPTEPRPSAEHAPPFTSRVPNVRDFGAKGDGVSDDTDAIQAAIDYVKPGSSAFNSPTYGSRVGRVFVPIGRYLVRRPLKVWSGVWIDGAGHGSTLEAAGDFPAGGAILKSSTEGLSPEGYGGCTVTNLHVKARGGSGIWAYSHSEMKSVGTLRAENLWIETPKGFDLTPYTQNSWVKNVLFSGDVDQMLRVKGNFNTFEQLDKEGATGSSADPYIEVDAHKAGNSSSNHFRSILIEQLTSPNKPLFAANGADELVLEDFWLEPTKTNGYGVILDRSRDFQIRGHFSHVGSWGKVAVRNGSWGSIETLNADGEDVPWSSTFEVDASSFLRTGTTFSRRSGNALPLDASSRIEHGVVVDRMLSLFPKAGISAVSRPRSVAAQNLLQNPSFEQGGRGWTLPPGFAVKDFPAAEIGPGRMLHLAGGTGTAPVFQEIEISPSWVGHTLTLSFAGRVAGPGMLTPYVKGAGLDLGQGSFLVSDGDGWVLASVTIQPRSAGKLAVGATFAGAAPASHAYVDEFRLAFGAEGLLAGGQFQELELGGRTVTAGSGPPTGGSSKPGDLVLGDGAAAGRPLGWRAVADGGASDRVRWEEVPVPLHGVVQVDGAAIPAQHCVDFAVPVPGARPGGECAPGASPPPPANTSLTCLVAAPDQAVVRVCNPTAASERVGASRLSARVFSP